MTNAEHSELTRAALVKVARKLFAEKGYAGVGTEDLARAAKLTRGAVYHHYQGKQALFEAVVRELMEQIHDEMREAARGAKDVWKGLRRGVSTFLASSERAEFQRIVFVDAPSVLGWQRWRALDAEYGLGLLRNALGAAIEAGVIQRQPLVPLAHVLLGAFTEAAMLIGHAVEPATTRREVEQTLDALLEGLRR
jgi:AcrR family transcriptional regulator